MMRLDPLQHAFVDYVLSGTETVRKWVRPSSKADIDTLLGVYRHAYSARLVEVLGNDFPGLKALAGVEPFDNLARAYIAAHPSRGFSVRTAGRSLAEFLARTPPYAARPALADMARFEWAMAHAFDAADAEPIRIEHMAAVPAPAWPTLTLDFHPSAMRVSLRTAVAAAWAAQNNGESPTEPAQDVRDWLLWRQDLDVKFRPVDLDESAALATAMTGGDFSALCEELAEHGPEDQAAYRAAGLIRAWIEAGLIVGIAHEGAVSG
jgi:Putative DNA-binding domain